MSDVNIRIIADEDERGTLLQAVRMNGGYCPCKLDKTPDTKCMCKEFRDFVAAGKLGFCHCGLYESY